MKALLIGLLLGLVSQAALAAPPNVVILLSDDQAYVDYSFMGHKVVRTPAIDKLAKEGVAFTRGYVPTSLCRSSLMSILSGQYPHQHLITGNDPPKGTDRAEMLKHVRRVPMLPRILAEHGYACFQSGKWWEGNFKEGGFTAGMTHGDVARGGRHGDEGLKVGRQGNQPVYDFLESRGEKPFFIWYAPMLPHQPHNPPERLLEKYRNRSASLHMARYWAMCEWWDEQCGELLDYLKKKGLAENTLVVYLADNGWIQDSAAAKYHPRSKRSPFEGGIRTPIILRWPAQLKPKQDDTSLASSIDLAPTILAACGIEASKEMQGMNLLEVAGGGVKARDAVFGEIYEHDVADVDHAGPGLLYRWCIAGKWKLILPKDGKNPELYDLAADAGERNNLADSQPEEVKVLTKKIEDWWGKGSGSPLKP
ncbi:MAG: sulfatase [Pirellulaceae bacterium]|nr:sulfatase [Pirellulaceae bacterium]